MRTEPENEREVRAALNARLGGYGFSTEIAKQLGVSTTYISLVRSGKKPISPKVAAFLGFRRVVKWEQEA